MFERLGHVAVVDEKALDLVSALSGAGPALLAWLAGALASSAEQLGLPAGHARALVAETMRGTGLLLTAGGMPVEGVVDAVASPGGMTEAALRTLADRDVPGALHAALRSAVRRASVLRDSEPRQLTESERRDRGV